jgi:uncharacterized protein YcbX
MPVAVVSEIRRYPVKSMAGETLDAVDLAEHGLPGDRAWAVRDEVRGGIRGAKKIAALMELSSRYAKEPAREGSSPAEIGLPDGSILETGDPEVNARLSAAIDHAVSLWPLVSAEQLDHYTRGAPTHDDMMEELRAIFGRLPDEPLPDLSIFPPEIMQYESPPGTYFDAFPLMLLSQSSLDAMAGGSPDSAFDVRRFRPNFVVDDTGDRVSFPEQEWRGRRIRMGEAVIEMTVECPRCVMVTHGFADLPQDRTIMRSLVKETGGILGVYARVETPGRVALGDSVELLD